MSMTVFLTALISAMLINNVLLSRFLGVCPFLGVSSRVNSSISMSLAVFVVMIISSTITYFIYYLVLAKSGTEFLRTIVFILVIASTVQFIELFLKKKSKTIYKALGIYLPLITTNCAILGVAEGNIINDYYATMGLWGGFGMSMADTIGTALGFGLVMFLFSTIRARLDSVSIPAENKGVIISLIVAGVMAFAFVGLQGLV